MGQRIQDYKLLIKFRLSSLVVFSSVLAYLIAAQGQVSWIPIVLLAIGGMLVTGAANALNQVLERDYDKLMKRTADRPIAAGRMQVSEGVMAAGLMSLFGITILAVFNPWTAFLGMISLLMYSFVYTPMKRVSPTAVFVGAIPGALPTMIGAVAYQGEITTLALSLFAIQFIWQFPHFWSIAWLAFEDYFNAGFYLLPTSKGVEDRSTALQSTIYAALLIPVGCLPYWLGVTGITSAIGAVLLGIMYTYCGWLFYRQFDRAAGRKLMFSSFIYLPILLILFFVDKI